jgi:hypothetical protein
MVDATMNATIGLRRKTCLAAAMFVLGLSGCASSFDLKPVESVPFIERAVTQVENDVRVTAAVPDKKETRELFGLSLYKKDVQPVWIEIENMTDHPVGFLPFSVDADYHTPLEIASLTRGDKKRQEAEQQQCEHVDCTGRHPFRVHFYECRRRHQGLQRRPLQRREELGVHVLHPGSGSRRRPLRCRLQVDLR